MKLRFIKRENASELVLIMMVWAVISLLSTRLYLNLTGYPLVGNGRWHIAHALWGGMIMVVGMVTEMAYHGDKNRKIAAGVFGVGLGLFLDEVGKYLSRDNNYFFQPAIIFIYIFFVMLFLFYRYLERNSRVDNKTLLYQVISQLEEVAEGDLEEKEKSELIQKLRKVIKTAEPNTSQFAKQLRQLIKATPQVENRKPGWEQQFWRWTRRFFYNKIFKRRYVLNILTVVAFFYTISGIAETLYIWPKYRNNMIVVFWLGEVDLLTRSDVRMFVLKAISDLAASILFGTGLYWVIRKKRKRGINFFQYGLLVTIFLTSVFRFYFEQFSAVFGLALSMVIFSGLTRLKREIQG